MGGIFGLCTEEGFSEKLFRMALALSCRHPMCDWFAIAGDKEIQIKTHHALSDQMQKNNSVGLEGCYGVGYTVYKPVRKFFGPRSKEFVVGFYGSIGNAHDLRQRLVDGGFSFAGIDNDPDLLAGLIAMGGEIPESIENVLCQIVGHYTLVVLTCQGIYATQDLHSQKPLLLGELDGGQALTSDPLVFDDSSRFRTLDPGEIVFLNKEGAQRVNYLQKSLF